MGTRTNPFTFLAVLAYTVSTFLLVGWITGSQTFGAVWWQIVLFLALGAGMTFAATRAAGDEATPTPKTEPLVAPAPAQAPLPATTPAPQPAAPAPKAPATPDDLTRIEGIGPKMSQALIAAGIDTYAKLATQSLDDIRAAIDAAGMRFAPSAESWAEQAALAAAANWDALDALQATLEGGRYPKTD